MKKLPAKWIASLLDVGRQVLDAVRWRGPFSFLLLTVREIFKPFVYWHVFYIVENDLTHQPPRLYAKKHFVVRFYQGEAEIAGLGPLLSALGELTVDEILVRAQRGDLAAVAFAGTEPVGYSWMSRSSELPLVFNATWIMHSNEAVLYGSFVRPRWRGQGIHNWLDLTLNARAREDGLVRTIGSMAVYNRQTLALAKHTKKSRIMIVALARVRGLVCPWVMALGCPFGSRFRLDGSSAEKIAESFPRPASELNVP